MPAKKPWFSKSIWVNVIIACSAFVPGINQWLVAHPEFFVAFFAVVNVLLRFISKGAISMEDVA